MFMTKGQKWLQTNGSRFVIKKGQVWDKLKGRTVPLGSVAGLTDVVRMVRILNKDYENRVWKKVQ